MQLLKNRQNTRLSNPTFPEYSGESEAEMRKIWTMFLAITLVLLFLFPVVSVAGGHHYGGYDQRGHGRISGGDHSLFTIAATAAGFVIGGFLNAPAYWGDPHYRNRCSDSETEFWTEDSTGYRYRVRTGSRYCD